MILRDLLKGTKRYSELTKSVVGISAKVLTENLRDLEHDGIIKRTVYPVVPPKVLYSLTKKGQDLENVIRNYFDLNRSYDEMDKEILIPSSKLN